MRTQLALGTHMLTAIGISAVVVFGSVTPVVLWAAGGSTLLSLGTALFMLDVDSTGAVTNRASVFAGRPVALTARGREQITLDRIAPERVRMVRAAFATAVVGVLLLAAMVAAAFALAPR